MREAIVFVVVSSLVFVVAAFQLGPICFALSPVALAIVFWYSLAKRFTTYTQLFLGLAMAVAPVGGWLAAGGGGGWEPWLLGLAIGTWVGGFDVLYACQDLAFDRAHGLRSIPVRFGVARSLLISRGMHVITVICLAALGPIANLGWIYDAGVARRRAAAGLRAVAGERTRSVAGQAGVRSERLRRHPLPGGDDAGDLCPLTRRARSRWRSPAPAARSTPRERWRRCSSGAASVELIVTEYGRRLLRDELGDIAAVEQLTDYLVATYGEACARRHLHALQQPGSRRQIASGSQDCQAMVVVPCSMKTLAGIAHGLSRTLIERAADVMLKERRTLVIVPRETPMSLPQLRNMVLCAEAGAIVMPAMPAFYQMPKTLDDLADFMAGKILSALGFSHDLYPQWGS